MGRASLLACGLLYVGLAGCGSGGGFPDAPAEAVPPGPAKFTVEWKVSDLAGNAIACDKISGATVTATLTSKQMVGGFTEVFTCATLMGTSQTFAPGTYDVSWELDSTTGAVLATAPTQTMVTFPGDGNVTLAPLAFAVDATGKLNFSMSANKPGGNCGTGADGAKIDQFTISLIHGNQGACEPVSFTITAGATQPAGTYTIDCTTPAVTGCIENDQQLMATSVPSDSYTFDIRGKTAGVDCWKNTDSVKIPANGATKTTSLNLAPTGNPGC